VKTSGGLGHLSLLSLSELGVMSEAQFIVTLARGNFSRKTIGGCQGWGNLMWVLNQGFKSLACPWVTTFYSECQYAVNNYLSVRLDSR
jgi:hypothetical protein